MALLSGKLEGELDIKSEAHLFHDVFSNRPHHVSNITPGHIQGCEIHEGDWGKAGALSLTGTMFTNGVESVAKEELIEEIDDVNNSTTFKVIEGHLLDVYKTFRLIVKATPKVEGGSLVHWTLEFEKLNADGVESVAKELIEEIDDVNNSTTFKVIEGHLLDVYKAFRIIVKATPKAEGGSLVHCTLEFEKLNADTPDPNSLLEFCLNVSKDIDEHLQEQLAAEAQAAEPTIIT